MAYIFIIAGWGKLTAYGATAGYMESMGVPGALLPLTILVEFGGGLGKSGGSFRSRFYGDVRVPTLQVTEGDIEVEGRLKFANEDGDIMLSSNKSSLSYTLGSGANNGAWSFAAGDVFMPANLDVKGVITATNVTFLTKQLVDADALIARLQELATGLQYTATEQGCLITSLAARVTALEKK